MSARIKQLSELSALRSELEQRAHAQAQAERRRAAQRTRGAAASSEFRQAMSDLGDVQPLARPRRSPGPRIDAVPEARSRAADDREALAQSVSDEIDIHSLLDTDERLSYCRPGIGPEVLRKLRRGHWVIQDELDLHGHRVDGARLEVAAFLKAALKRGRRCVRIVHGKGLGSKDRQPVLKNKVLAWLAQRDEVIAFCQARAADGGSGALVVLLRPTSPAA